MLVSDNFRFWYMVHNSPVRLSLIPGQMIYFYDSEHNVPPVIDEINGGLVAWNTILERSIDGKYIWLAWEDSVGSPRMTLLREADLVNNNMERFGGDGRFRGIGGDMVDGIRTLQFLNIQFVPSYVVELGDASIVNYREYRSLRHTQGSYTGE